MTKIKNTYQLIQSRQAGGALLVAMIMIFMLSVMGISSMRGSTLERQMATNSIQTATTFQGAESTGEFALNDADNLQSAYEIADIAAIENGELDKLSELNVPVDLQQDIGMVSSANIVYVGEGAAPGYSRDEFIALRFEAHGNATVQAIRADALVTQGAYRIVPNTK